MTGHHHANDDSELDTPLNMLKHQEHEHIANKEVLDAKEAEDNDDTESEQSMGWLDEIGHIPDKGEREKIYEIGGVEDCWCQSLSFPRQNIDGSTKQVGAASTSEM